jgi:hypothetical protein
MQAQVGFERRKGTHFPFVSLKSQVTRQYLRHFQKPNCEIFTFLNLFSGVEDRKVRTLATFSFLC